MSKYISIDIELFIDTYIIGLFYKLSAGNVHDDLYHGKPYNMKDATCEISTILQCNIWIFHGSKVRPQKELRTRTPKRDPRQN